MFAFLFITIDSAWHWPECRFLVRCCVCSVASALHLGRSRGGIALGSQVPFLASSCVCHSPGSPAAELARHPQCWRDDQDRTDSWCGRIKSLDDAGLRRAFSEMQALLFVPGRLTLGSLSLCGISVMVGQLHAQLFRHASSRNRTGGVRGACSA